MNDLIVWRDKLQELYAMKSIYIDKAVQFVLALVTFLMINQNIGLMKAVATPVVAVALAVICTFLPPVVTAYVAAGLVIVHLFKLSIGVAAAAALIFVVMFIFYCRFTPKKALLLLVTPVAFMLHVPYVVPVACALVLGPISAVPVVFGTIIYYMIECVRTSATAITSADLYFCGVYSAPAFGRSCVENRSSIRCGCEYCCNCDRRYCIRYTYLL